MSSRLRTLAFDHRGCAGLPRMFLLNLRLWLHAFSVFRVVRIIDHTCIFSYLNDKSNSPPPVVRHWKLRYGPVYIRLISPNLSDHHQLSIIRKFDGPLVSFTDFPALVAASSFHTFHNLFVPLIWA